MKQKVLIIVASIAVFFSLNTLSAQEPSEIAKDENKPKITGKIEVTIDADEVKKVSADTTKIRMGKKEIIIIGSGDNTDVDVRKMERKEEKERDQFDGHWAGLDLGINGFADENYSMYNSLEFMELNQPKSLEVNLNFAEFNIGLQKNKNNIGLVTGMGISYNNYKFDNPYTIRKVNGIIEPLALSSEGYEKSKLTVAWLTVPLMLEFQIPVNDRSNNLFVAGGIVGGLNIGSHTKVKWDDKKEKERGGFSINPFKYAAICRVGLNDISLFATYNLTPLFKNGKGPELTPFSVGISFINF